MVVLLEMDFLFLAYVLWNYTHVTGDSLRYRALCGSRRGGPKLCETLYIDIYIIYIYLYWQLI